MKCLWGFPVFILILTAYPFLGQIIVFAGIQEDGLTATEPDLRPDGTMRAFTGEVLRMGEDGIVVKDPTGTETPLRIDKFTAMIGEIKKGDPIEAHISGDGQILSIRRIFQTSTLALSRS